MGTKTHCNVCVFYGPATELYSFPDGHPLNSARVKSFWGLLKEQEEFLRARIRRCEPVMAEEQDIMRFHSKEYISFVKKASLLGHGYLDAGDTPAFKGVFEASSYVVGSTLLGLNMIMKGSVQHAFNPVGGLHHARRDTAGGFCVFNDAAIAIQLAKEKYGITKLAYVDIDAHHGDGVYYEFEDDPTVYIADIHEDGTYLYPGTGHEYEKGKGTAEGTKLNIPLQPQSGDAEFSAAFSRVQAFITKSQPELIILQCGADGLDGDPLTHLRYSVAAHRLAANWLHEFSHEACQGRLLVLGGGGYNAQNTAQAWVEVVKTMSERTIQ